jgi:26S proteasome regulatory subunit N7
MAPFYEKIGSELGGVDGALLASLKSANEKRLKELDAAIVDATENLGENEIREANLAKAEYLNRIGDKVRTR